MTVRAGELTLRVVGSATPGCVALELEGPAFPGRITGGELELTHAGRLSDALAQRIASALAADVEGAISCLQRSYAPDVECRGADLRGLETFYRLLCGAVAGSLTETVRSDQLRRIASVARLFSELADLTADRYDDPPELELPPG